MAQFAAAWLHAQPVTPQLLVSTTPSEASDEQLYFERISTPSSSRASELERDHLAEREHQHQALMRHIAIQQATRRRRKLRDEMALQAAQQKPSSPTFFFF